MPHKTRPAPLKNLQATVHTDESRRYLILDAHSSLPSPAYPFDQQDNYTWQVEPGVDSDTLDYRWHDLGNHDVSCARSFSPPISPPALSPDGRDTVCSSKRSARTFALVPAQVNGKHVFTHVVVDPQDSDSKDRSRPTSREGSLPEDMQDILRQLDDLASWVKAASSPTNYNVASIVHVAGRRSTGNLSDGLFPNKGKNRLLSTGSPSERDVRRDLVNAPSGTASGNPLKASSTDFRSEGFIYVPDCNTPEFLAGSSSSPIAYPVCGYSSHRSRYPLPVDSTHDISHHRHLLERRSAPCPPPTSPLVSPPSGKSSFKTLFQRSRCNTTAAARPSIPSGHVPIENTLRQGKRTRLLWLRI